MRAADEHYHRLACAVVQQLEPELWAEICRAPRERLALLLDAVGVVHPELHLRAGDVGHPEYRNVPSQIAAELLLGIPVGVGLTAAERHEWLKAGAKQPPKDWLLLGTGLEARSIEIARWLQRMISNPEQREALYRVRREGALAEHTMDLLPEDCTGGVNEAVARRRDRHAVGEYGAEPLAEAPSWLRKLGGRVVPLLSAPALASEGRAMQHCVGGYASQVAAGTSVIARIRAWGLRATVEYDRRGRLVTCLGARNEPAHPICRRLAELATTAPRK